jgi:hypothetical protein
VARLSEGNGVYTEPTRSFPPLINKTSRRQTTGQPGTSRARILDSQSAASRVPVPSKDNNLSDGKRVNHLATEPGSSVNGVSLTAEALPIKSSKTSAKRPPSTQGKKHFDHLSESGPSGLGLVATGKNNREGRNTPDDSRLSDGLPDPRELLRNMITPPKHKTKSKEARVDEQESKGEYSLYRMVVI